MFVVNIQPQVGKRNREEPKCSPERCLVLYSLSTKMTSYSTSSSQWGKLISELLSQERPFEPQEASFSKSGLLDGDYVYGDLKSIMVNDEDRRRLMKDLRRMKFTIAEIPQEKAEKKNREEDTDSSDSEESTESENDKAAKIYLAFHVGLLPERNESRLSRMELRSFILKLWLRRIELTKNEDKDKYDSLKNFEQAISIAQEAIKRYKFFLYKKYYNRNLNRELEAICFKQEEDLEKLFTQVFEEKEKARFEMTEEDLQRFLRQTCRVCALLGLKLDFLDDLEKTPQDTRYHRKPSDWIEIFLEDSTESVDIPDKYSLNKETLASIGFDPLSEAVETIHARAESFTETTQQHIEASEWAQLFIKDEFQYNPLLSPSTPRFPFQTNTANDWFQLPNEETENDQDLCHVYLMNLETKESQVYSKTRTILEDSVPQDEQNVVLYHGTDHNSAKKILMRGINLYAGRLKRDFSCGKGFYLTTQMEHALNWAKSTTARPAILIFIVSSERLNNARKLNLNEDEVKWREIVSCFRNAQQTAKMRKSLSQSYELIEGPMATATLNDPSGEWVFEPKPSSNQMCLISDEFAEEFEKSLHSVVFFNIN